MKIIKSLIFWVLLGAVGSPSLTAAGKTDAGLILLDVPSARPAALGQAFTAMSDDVSAYLYNPATLNSLKTGHASFLYQNGIFDDSSGQLLLGHPLHRGGVGLSIGYYNGGDIVLTDGNTQREVTAQRDLMMSLGVARGLGLFSFGVTGKVLSSELAETEHATAYAMDFGLCLALNSRWRFGTSIQNVGSKLKFNEQGDDLPRIARVGFSYLLVPSGFKTNLLVDAPYYVNHEELRPSLGLETLIGPMAFRIGYRGGNNSQEFSIGTGFWLGQANFDYALGIVNDLDSVQRISLGYQFGGFGIRPEPDSGRINKETLQHPSELPAKSEEYFKLDETPTIIFPQPSGGALSEPKEAEGALR